MTPIEWIELCPSDGGILTHLPQQHSVPAGSTVAQALAHLGWGEDRIQAALQARAIAVFGLYAKADTVLHPHDRLEFLPPLQLDPKERRRKHVKTTKRAK